MKTKTLLLTAVFAATAVAFVGADSHAKAKVVHKTSVHETTTTHTHKVKDNQNLYVRLEAGLALPAKAKFTNNNPGNTLPNSGKFKGRNSMALGIGIGHIASDYFRSDFTLGYRSYDYKYSGDKLPNSTINGGLARTVSGLANGYLEAPNSTAIKPYLLAGLGVGWVKPSIKMKTNANNGTIEVLYKSTTNLIWNVGVGARAQVSDSIDADLTYKYISLGNLKLKDVDGTKDKVKNVRANEILAGLIFRF